MQANAHFSLHAAKRISERTSLSTDQVGLMLDHGASQLVGRKPGMRRNHILIYSIPDEAFFVAIQDELMGTVVTLLTVEYHTNLAWKLSEHDCQMAKDRAQKFSIHQGREKSETPPTTFIISAAFIENSGERKTKVIKRVKSEGYNDDINRFFESEDLVNNVDEYCLQKSICPSCVFAISVRFGKNGYPLIITLRDGPFSYADV